MASVQLTSVCKTFGNVEVIRDVNIEISDGEFVVFVGPSGCGKSTLLRLIAGLEELTSGDIRIGKQVVNHLEPKDRGIAMVFQSYAIFPHMTVRENIAFGLTVRKENKRVIDRKVAEAARMLQMEDLLDRRPSQLSGGQRQRVAIGRAVVRNPTVFLFDEPLSNLDAALRMSTRQEIATLHAQLQSTMIYVTHDQVEAMTLADKIVVLKNGEVMQCGAPMELYHHPANLFVAGFLGAPSMNFLTVRVDEIIGSIARVSCAAFNDLEVTAGLSRLQPGQNVTLGIRPQHLIMTSNDKGTVSGSVLLAERLGSETVIDVALSSGEKFIAALPEDTVLHKGQSVSFRFDAQRTHLFTEELT